MRRILSPTLSLLMAHIASNGHTVTASFGSHVIEMGVCENQETLQLRCIMQPSDCKPTHVDGKKHIEGEKYLNINQQKLNEKYMACGCEDTPAHLCLTPKDDDPSQFVKKCVPDISACDMEKGSLLGSSKDAEKHCTCSHTLMVAASSSVDDERILGPTLYGACQDVNNDEAFFCAFRSSDCETPYVWVDPEDTEELVGTQCTCDKVRTGACHGGFVVHGLSGTVCSLTSDACGYGNFFPPISLKRKHGESCRLCGDGVIIAEASQKVIAPDAVDAVETETETWFILGGSCLGVILLLFIMRFIICNPKKRSTTDTMKGDQVVDSAAVETKAPDPTIEGECEMADAQQDTKDDETTLKELL